MSVARGECAQPPKQSSRRPSPKPGPWTVTAPPTLTCQVPIVLRTQVLLIVASSGSPGSSGLSGSLHVHPRPPRSPLVTCLVRGAQMTAGLVDGRAGSCGHTTRQIDRWISTSTIDATALNHRTGVAAGARMDLSGIKLKKQEVVARGGWMIGR